MLLTWVAVTNLQSLMIIPSRTPSSKSALPTTLSSHKLFIPSSITIASNCDILEMEIPQCRFWFINEFNHALVNLVCSSRGLRRRSSTAGVLSNFTSWSSMRIWRWSFRRFGRWTGVCGWGFRWCINSVAIVSKNSSRFPHSVRIEMTSFSAIAMSTFRCVRSEHASEISRNHRIKYLTLYHGWWRGALSGWQE